METLELKIPPPVVALIVATAMWGASTMGLVFDDVPRSIRVLTAGIFCFAGLGFILLGVAEFYRARTTVNPLKPQATSSLVTGGIYRYTRNPMYIGLLFILVAWAAWLSSAWALIGPVIFVLYITRFQILPEERALAAIFGTAFSDYKDKVRRWL